MDNFKNLFGSFKTVKAASPLNGVQYEPDGEYDSSTYPARRRTISETSNSSDKSTTDFNVKSQKGYHNADSESYFWIMWRS